LEQSISFVMNLDGTDARSLVYRGRQLTRFGCSSNGVYLTFIAGDGLFTLNVNDGIVYQIPTRNVDEIRLQNVSNDGRQVVADIDGNVVIINATTGTRQFLTHTRSQHEGAAFISPDGTRVVYAAESNAGIRWNVMLQAVDSANARLLYPGAAGPEWSPDGQMVVAAGNFLGRTGSIGLIDATRNLNLPLTSIEHHDAAPSWSPDGRWIVFTRMFSGSMMEIFLLNLSSGAETRVTNNLTNESVPCFLRARPDNLIPRPSIVPNHAVRFRKMRHNGSRLSDKVRRDVQESCCG
jgi:tricorn protease-like protein